MDRHDLAVTAHLLDRRQQTRDGVIGPEARPPYPAEQRTTGEEIDNGLGRIAPNIGVAAGRDGCEGWQQHPLDESVAEGASLQITSETDPRRPPRCEIGAPLTLEAKHFARNRQRANIPRRHQRQRPAPQMQIAIPEVRGRPVATVVDSGVVRGLHGDAGGAVQGAQIGVVAGLEDTQGHVDTPAAACRLQADVEGTHSRRVVTLEQRHFVLAPEQPGRAEPGNTAADDRDAMRCAHAPLLVLSSIPAAYRPRSTAAACEDDALEKGRKWDWLQA